MNGYFFKDDGYSLSELKSEFLRIQNEMLELVAKGKDISELELYELRELKLMKEEIEKIMYYDYDYCLEE